MPLFDEDLEASEGMPDNAQALIDLFLSHNALLISSPEYNSSISAVLKNTIDWVSRPKDGVAPLAPFAGKVAALLAASPGGLGGLRGLVHLRSILGNMQVTVLPDQVAVPQVHNLLGGGQLTDQGQQDKVAALGRKLAEISAKLH